MSESAQKRGKKLLERFQEEKHSARKASAATAPAYGSPSYKDGQMDAIANGSLLGICYSESKKKDRSSTPKIKKNSLNNREGDDEDLEAESPLEMLRFALLQLSSLEGNAAVDTGSLNNITSLLQGVEEFLERSNSTRLLAAGTPRRSGKLNTKLGFSVEKPSRRIEGGDEDEILNQSTYTPIKADQSSIGGYRTQRSIFMENQLDLNESEMEYYEDIVNDLASKLERMQEEKDDLQSISNALGERLQRLSQSKEEALQEAGKEFEGQRVAMQTLIEELQSKLELSVEDFNRELSKVADLESNLSIMRAKLKDDDKKLLQISEQNATLASQVSKLTEELQILNGFQKEEAQLTQIQMRQQEKAADTLQSTVASLTKQRQELADRVAELEHSAGDASTLRAQLSELRRAESQLMEELTSLRSEREQQDENHQHEVLGLQKKLLLQEQDAHKQQHALQQRITQAESELQDAHSHAAQASQHTHTAAGHAEKDNHKDATERERRHREEVERLKETIQDLQVELEDSQAEVDNLSSTIEDLRLRIDTGEHAADAAPTNQRAYDAGRSFQYENEADISVVRIAPSPFGKHVERYNTSLNSPGGQKNVLKVYMDNQLDLNEEEMQYYETIVNDLASQVEGLRLQVGGLSAERDALLSAREALQDSVRELQANLEDTEHELHNCHLHMSELTQENTQLKLQAHSSPVQSATKRLPGPSPASHVTSKTGPASAHPVTGRPPLTPQQVLVNEFLGLDAGNESDPDEVQETERTLYREEHSFETHHTFERTTRHDTSTLSDSFHSTQDHVLGRSDVDDLQRLVKQREQQVKVQIAQLQAQQDSIQELRNALEVMKTQKHSLKKSLSDATARVDELQHHEVNLLNKVHGLEEQLQDAQERVEDLQHQCVQAEDRYEETKNKVNDLLQVTTQYRLDLEQLQEQQRHSQQALLGSGKKTASTPSPPTTHVKSVNDSGGSRHESSTMAQRLKRAEAQVDELALQVRMTDRTNEEVQLEYDKLQVRFQAKLRLAEEQNQDILDLRLEIDKLLEENDRIKLHEMQTEANSRLVEIDNQGEIELLQRRVLELEDENRLLMENLRARQLELQQEVESNRSLKEILNKFGDRGTATEGHLLELRTERDAARKQLVEVSERLQVQARTVTEYHERYELLQRQMVHRDSEVSSMQKRIELLQGEAQGEARSLYLRLEDLSNETQSVEDALREQKQKTAAAERDVKARTAELENSRRSLRNLVDIVRTHYSKVLNAQDGLAQQVQTKLARVDARIDSATWSVHHTISEVAAVMNGTENDRRIVERALKDTQALLEKALDRHDHDAQEKDEAWNKYDAAQQHVEDLQRMLDDVHAQLAERIDMHNNNDAQAQVLEEEFLSIKQRLSEAELRAEQMSTENARSFAKSARTVAYLEGECTRLKTLLDHQRVVNVKLTGDLKNAHLEGMRCKSLEHRLKLSDQDQASLQKRVDTLESAVQQKEHDLLEALDTAREQEEERSERFEIDYNSLNSQYRALQEKYASLAQDHAAAKLSLEQATLAHASELDSLTGRYQASEKEVARHHAKVEELEFQMRNVRHTMQETELLYSQANTKISLLIEEARITKETHASTLRELTIEVQDRTENARAKDQQLAQLKSQVNRLESDFVQRDEEIASKLLRRVTADDENRQLRIQLDAQTGDLTLMRSRIEDLQVQVTSLSILKESLQEQADHSKTDYEAASGKLQESRDLTRQLSEELDALQAEYSKARETITICRAELSATENKLHTIQTDFFAIQANEQALVTHNETLAQDNAYLRKQVDELVPKLSSSSREVVALRNQLSEQAELVTELQREAQDYESRTLQIKHSFEAYEIAEADIVAEMREISDLLASNVGVDPSVAQPSAAHPVVSSTGSSTGDHHEAREQHFQIGMHLFASPPLAVMRSPLNLYSASDGTAMEGTDLTADMTATQSDVLSSIKYNISTLKCRSNNLLTAYLKTFESLKRTCKEKEDVVKDFERAKEKIQLAAYDKDVLLGKLRRADEEQEALRNQVEALEERAASWATTSTANSQRTSAVLREMDNCLLESLAKAHDAVAGVIPIHTDALPNLRISEAIIQFDEARGRTSFNQLASFSSATQRAEADQHSTSAVLTVSANEVSRATEYLVGVIRNVVQEYRRQTEQLHKAEGAVDQRESAWEKERKNLFAQQAELEIDIESLHHKHAKVAADLEAYHIDLERANHRIEELLDHNAALDNELKATLDDKADLKQELGRIEATCMDLRSKMRTLQLDVDKRNEEIGFANEQLQETRLRITESELNHERTSSLLGRTRAEKEALDNVRRSLESELERSRAEVIAMRECTKVLDDENRSSFEVEKILAALTTTMDQIVSTSGTSAAAALRSNLNTSVDQNLEALAAAAGSAASSFISVERGALTTVSCTAGGQDVPLAARVDTAVKRLSNLRHWAREEARSKRMLDGQLEALTLDVSSAQASADEAQRQLKQMLQSNTHRDKELKEKTAELLEKELELRRVQEMLQHLQTDGSSVHVRLEDEKKRGMYLAEQVAAKDQLIAALRGEVESRSGNLNRLQEQAQTANEQLAAALEESAKRAEQLRVAKTNSERIMSTMEQVERGAAADKRERENAERRCVEAEEQLASLNRIRARAAEMEDQLTVAKDESKAATRAKVAAEELTSSLQHELYSSQKKVISLEHRIETIMQEKNTFVDEVAETRRKIALAKQYADQERAQRMKADAAMALLKRSGEENRVDLVEYATMAEEAENVQSRAEEEKRSLRSKINELKHICDAKETLRVSEQNDRKKLESDIKQLKTALAKRNAELASSSNYSSQLRSEGRHARQLVMHAVKHIREILTIVKLDAKAAGMEILSPDGSKTRGHKADEAPHSGQKKDPLEVSYDDALPLGLGEALGINDLTQALESLREAMVYISAAPVNRQTLQAKLSQLEVDHAAVQRELEASESKRTELVRSYKEEIQTMHLHITELRRNDSKNPHLMHQISELEATVKVEKERRERAMSEVTLLKSRMEQMSREAANAPHSHRSSESILQVELETMRTELNQHRAQNEELVQELNAVNHHRTVLRDTIEQLDREVREKVDMITDLQASKGLHSSAHWAVQGLEDSFGASMGRGQRASTPGAGLHTEAATAAAGEVEEGLQRQVLRYKARAAAVDELATIYRTSVLALYADGASYGAAQFGWQPHGMPVDLAPKTPGVHLIGVGWIEREMNAVKHSYEDEARLLDAEVAELRAKQRQANLYIVELRKRFEENMRSIYRSGKGSAPSEGMSLQFEQMQRELETMHNEMASLQQDLTAERSHSRHRHGHLVETLTAALQARDAALGALKRLEGFCADNGVEIAGLAIYENLKADMSSLNAATNAYIPQHQHGHHHQQQVVDTLMRGIVEVDHELAESERRNRARQRAAASSAGSSTGAVATSSGNTSMNQSRSNSRGSSSRHVQSSHAVHTTHTSGATGPTAGPSAAAPVLHMHTGAHSQMTSNSNMPPPAPAASHGVSYSSHSSRHQSPGSTRPHPSAPATHHSSLGASAGVSTPYVGSQHSTPARASSGYAARQREQPNRDDSADEHQRHEQRLTRDFLTKTSPATSPQATSSLPQPPVTHQPHIAPVTHSHTAVTSTHVLSTSAITSSTRMRTTAGRETSYQLPVASHSSGSGSLRVNRASTPVSSVNAPSATSNNNINHMASGIPSHTIRRVHRSSAVPQVDENKH